jgi:uncharacterized protein
MLTKLLLLILLGVVAVSWFKSRSRPHRDIGKPSRPEVEDMVRCKVCGINLPRSEALMSRGRIYCCDEHRQQDHE